MFLTIKNILLFFQNPHKNFLYFHIAGTKGKTSVAYYCYQMLLSAQKNAGLFVSPHVYDYKERIQYNGSFITDEEWSRLTEKIRTAEQKLGLKLTIFERYFMIAILFFQEQKVEYVVLEVGIGGLFDTTNVITPSVSLISKIQKDHQELLGRSLWSMVRNKLGIIKPNVPFIIGHQTLLGSVLIYLQTLNKRSLREKLFRFRINNKQNGEYEVLINKERLTLSGPYYMINNFVLAFSAIKKVLNVKPIWNNNSFCHNVPGRFERVALKPKDSRTIILDGAHNPLAFKVLKGSLQERFSHNKWVMVMIVKKNKALKQIVKNIKTMSVIVIIPTFHKEFGDVFDPTELIHWLKYYKVPVLYMDKNELFDYLLLQRFILITGSFYHLLYFKFQLENQL